jgi:hypothetical protein
MKPIMPVKTGSISSLHLLQSCVCITVGGCSLPRAYGIIMRLKNINTSIHKAKQ